MRGSITGTFFDLVADEVVQPTTGEGESDETSS